MQKYLGANAGATAGIFTSSTDFSYIDLQGHGAIPGLLQSALGGGLDSIRTINHVTIGAPTLGAQFLLIDNFQRDTLPLRGIQTRVVIGGAYRFATGLVDSARSTLGIATDDGAGVQLRSAMDVVAGNLGGTFAARFVKSFPRAVIAPLIGDPEALFPAPVFGLANRTAGTIVALDVTPRFLLGDFFSLDGHYGVERTGAPTYARSAPPQSCLDICSLASLVSFAPNTAATTAQRIGFGFRYSTVDASNRGRASYPLEVSFAHLETMSGDAGVPKVSRDQIQVRLYFQLRGAR